GGEGSFLSSVSPERIVRQALRCVGIRPQGVVWMVGGAVGWLWGSDGPAGRGSPSACPGLAPHPPGGCPGAREDDLAGADRGEESVLSTDQVLAVPAARAGAARGLLRSR